MRRPRMTLRRWMFVIAIMSAMLVTCRRPYPVAMLSIINGGDVATMLYWSDGSQTGYPTPEKNPTLVPIALRRSPVGNAVDWSDGTVDWYVKPFWAWVGISG